MIIYFTVTNLFLSSSTEFVTSVLGMFNSKIVFSYFFQVSILSIFPVCWILVRIFFFSSLSTFIMDVLVFVYLSLHLDLLKVIASHCVFPCIWSVTLCFCAFLIFLLKTRHFSYPIIASVDFVLFFWELLLVAYTWTAIFISPKCALTDVFVQFSYSYYILAWLLTGILVVA